jgi:PIN domain nuclease of toxin-antitoxin system
MATNSLLLDTHTFLWWVQDSKSLSVKARRAISSETSTCFLSVASVWEMAIKAALGKLNLAVSVEEFVSTHVAANNFKLLDVSFRHAARAEKLPNLHTDPFDRLLIVQAQTEDLSLVSRDTAFSQYAIKLLW